MKLSKLKTLLTNIDALNFKLPNGDHVPKHFHVTEVGETTKRFIDCGGTLREQKKVNFQLWQANDYDHRLAPQKLQKIISLAEIQLGLQDAEIEVEYQGNTIQRFGLEFDGKDMKLTSLHTDCLAKEECGVPSLEKVTVNQSSLSSTNCCTPESGCC